MQLNFVVPTRTVRRGRGVLVLLVLLAAGLLGVTGLEAQAGTTTGQIAGRVVTAAGEPLAAASVVATDAATGFQRSALTSADGRYVLRLLPPGVYTVRIQRIGYGTEEVQNVRVVLGQTVGVNSQLAESAVEIEGVEVRASAQTVNTREAAVAQTVGQEAIEALPSLGRDFTDFIALSGLVSPSPETTTGGQFSIGGLRPSQTNLQIDGVDANNSFFGENRGGSRLPFTFSLESIREFQIISNAYDVEYGNYVGGVVNVLTRGGTNDFSGTAYANYRGDALTAEDFAGDEPVDFTATQYAARVSGPIVRDKLFYLFSLDGQRRREPQVPISVQGFLTGENPDTATAEQLGQFIEILENQYGVANAAEGYRPFQTSEDQVTLFGRVDWTINDAHRLSLRHNYINFLNDNEFAPGFDFDYGRSRAERLEGNANSFVSELQSVLGENTFNVARMQFSWETRPRIGNDLRPTLEVRLPSGQRVRYGGTFAAFQNNMEERKFQLVNNFTRAFGRHTLKLGGNLIATNIRNQFQSMGSQSQGAGLYRFNTLEDFASFRPASYWRPLRPGGEVPFADFNVYEWAVFAQDQWQVTDRLTATLGLRYDQQIFADRPGRVIDVERAFGYETGIAPVDRNNVSPRLALAYDLFGDGDAVLRAGGGYFYGRVPYVLGGNVQQTEIPIFELVCSGSAAEGDPNAPPSVAGFRNWSTRGFDNPAECANTAGFTGVPTYTFWQPDFEYPETFKASLGYEQLLGNRMQASIDLVFTHATKLYTVRDINLRDPIFTLDNEGGRRVYVPASEFDPTNAATVANRVNTQFGPVYVNYNDGRQRAFSATSELARRFGAAGEVRASYTYTTSFDNSSYSCCTASAGYSSPNVGLYSPNDIGGIGASDRAWGASEHVRNHTFILSGRTALPLGFRGAAIWRLESGRPWTPEQGGDLNADGLRFNDRPFVFAPDDLPLATPDAEAAAEQRALYASFLDEYACVGDYVGQIVPRGTCRQPWFNRLDVKLSRSFETVGDQRLELEVDLFNVLNGLNPDWGRYESVRSSSRNLMTPVGYDAGRNTILYEVREGFGTVRAFDSLFNQFQAQIGIRYNF